MLGRREGGREGKRERERDPLHFIKLIKSFLVQICIMELRAKTSRKWPSQLIVKLWV